jgi:signal peptidase I
MYEPGRNKKLLTSKGKRSSSKEWIYAFFIAVIAALLIRLFAVEAFNIPSASMNNTLLEGDLIFVSKLPFGARMPITPLSLPLVHQNIPLEAVVLTSIGSNYPICVCRPFNQFGIMML